MEVKPIIVDDDHRRGWPEADPAVAQEPNATKRSLHLPLSLSSLAFSALSPSFSLPLTFYVYLSLSFLALFLARLTDEHITRSTCM